MRPRNSRISPDQKQILRDGLIFAVKLWLDGIKDVALGFLALGAVVIDLFRGRRAGGYLFYRVMKLGHRVDHVIDVYGGHTEPESLGGTKEQYGRSGDSIGRTR